MYSPLSQFDVINVIPLYFIGIGIKLDLSITNISLVLVLGIVLGIVVLNGFVSTYLIPYNWQIFIEMLFMFVFRILYEQSGKNGILYFPFIFSLFSFILIFNLLGLLPFGFALTSHLIWVLYFSTSICLGIFFLGIFNYQIKFFKLFVPKVPFLLYPLMIFLEIISYIIRSFSLGIRLSANIIAGHILVHIIASVIFALLCNTRYILVILPIMLLVAIFVLEVGVACLQAYIFTILVCMYLNDSVNLIEHH